MKRLMALSVTPILLLTSGCVSGLFYYPDRHLYQTPKQKGLDYEEVYFKSADGTKLHGWFVPAVGEAKGTIVHFHGNAQNMTAHFSFIDWLPQQGFNLFTFDYRGYGRSGGTPSRSGLFEDSLAALDYVRTRQDVDKNALLVLGQSLGGANAMAAVGKGGGAGVRAVAADSAFYSYRSIVRDKIDNISFLRWLKWPLSFLLIGNSHSPGKVADKISPIPLLLIHGTADDVIPYHHAQWLFEKAKEPKTLWTLEGAGHTAAFGPGSPEYKRRLVTFFNEALQSAPIAGTSPALTR